MAFSFTVTRRTVVGNFIKVIGTWTATGVTTGDIVTGLQAIEHSDIVDKTGVRASMSINDTTVAGTCTIAGVTAADTGTFEISGH